MFLCCDLRWKTENVKVLGQHRELVDLLVYIVPVAKKLIIKKNSKRKKSLATNGD
jgi:hypothetical protein